MSNLFDDDMIKVFDFLSRNPVIPYTIEQISDSTGVDVEVLKEEWDTFLYMDIVKEAKDNMYKRKDSEVVNKIDRVRRGDFGDIDELAGE